MEDTNPAFVLTLRIQYEDYLEFNQSLSEGAAQKSRRKLTVLGALEAVFGVVLLLLYFWTDRFGLPPYLLMGVILLLFAAYSLTYYKVIYKKLIARAAKKAYDKSEYLHSEIGLRLFGDRIEETCGGETNVVDWLDSDGVYNAENHYLLMLDAGRGIIIPKRVFEGERAEAFHHYLQTQCAAYEKPFQEL